MGVLQRLPHHLSRGPVQLHGPLDSRLFQPQRGPASGLPPDGRVPHLPLQAARGRQALVHGMEPVGVQRLFPAQRLVHRLHVQQEGRGSAVGEDLSLHRHPFPVLQHPVLTDEKVPDPASSDPVRLHGENRPSVAVGLPRLPGGRGHPHRPAGRSPAGDPFPDHLLLPYRGAADGPRRFREGQ